MATTHHGIQVTHAVIEHVPWGTVDEDRHYFVAANRSPISFNVSSGGDLSALADGALAILGRAAKALKVGGKSSLDSASVADFMGLPKTVPDRDRHDYVEHLMLFARWFMDGMPRVEVGHKHASMLACTGMPASVVREVAEHFPWWATAVQVPNKLLVAPLFRIGSKTAEAGEVATVIVSRMIASFDGIDVGDTETGSVVLCYLVPADPTKHDLTTLAFSTVEALASFVQGPRDVIDADPIAADAVLFMRFVLGAIAELIQHRPAGLGASPRSPRRKSDGRAVPTAYRVTRDVIVDCRPDLEAYRAQRAAARAADAKHPHPHAAPSVVVNVRGHFKMQPHGPRNTMRKLMWIDGYKYAPDAEDAPVAVRSHRLRHPADGAGECGDGGARHDGHE